MSNQHDQLVTITLIDLAGEVHRWSVHKGTNLRRALLDQQHTPYTRWTQSANCRGNGLCATCGVWIEVGETQPKHWHDWAAKRFGYPRLSCQVEVNESITIRLVKKWIWGKRRK